MTFIKISIRVIILVEQLSEWHYRATVTLLKAVISDGARFPQAATPFWIFQENFSKGWFPISERRTQRS